MKKTITLLITILCAITYVFAQESYYYYGGEQVQLTEDSTKIVSIIPKSENVTIPPASGLLLVNTVSDSRSIINVYEKTPSFTESSVLFVSAGLQKCFINSAGQELIPDGYFNVKLKESSDYSILETLAALYNCEIIEQNPFMPLWYNLHVIGECCVDVANAFYESGLFSCASPSFSFDALEISYDPNVYQQWALYNSAYEGLDISISKAWNYATGRSIKIAVVDQGIDFAHSDLANNIYPLSYDTESSTPGSKVYGDHGTHCAGIAAAVRNNGIFIAGVAPDAKLMSVSNTLSGTNGSYKLANGINWAWTNGADIISCSWWCKEGDLIKDAIDNAVSKGRQGKGCVFVKSAGNTAGPISFPGDYSEDVIAVANMTQDGSLCWDSARGPNMFVTAPGTNILSTIRNNQITTKTGTSMAAPHVAGLAALILERNPKLTAKQVREIIGRNAKKVGTEPYSIKKQYGTWNEKYGYGLIDAYQSVINTPRY